MHHVRSSIHARVGPPGDRDFFSVIFPSLFPGGSITGAPKKAAMDVIARLEKRPRGIYTGAIGFAGPDSARFNVAIRTLEIDRSTLCARLGAGCGIVWDSRAADEWNEYELKRSFVIAALDEFRLIETMRLSNGRYYLLLGHMRRLRKAAAHFVVVLRWKEILRTLRDQAGKEGLFRVRLTVSAAGTAEVTRTALHPNENGFVLQIVGTKVFSGDPFRRFKTSERRALDDERKRMQASEGAADVIFFNERDEITETSVYNLLLCDRAGTWFSPPGSSGSLPGVSLARLENRRPGRIIRKCLDRSDLIGARSVVVTNSVRGTIRVRRIYDEGGQLIVDHARKSGAVRGKL